MIRIDIDEAALNQKDRLGLAYCRLNSWEWDEMFGPKPEGWDAMSTDGKFVYISPLIRYFGIVLGEAETNRYWWLFCLGRSEEEWRSWYWGERLEYLAAQKPANKILRLWNGGDGQKGCREKLKELPALIRSLFAKH